MVVILSASGVRGPRSLFGTIASSLKNDELEREIATRLKLYQSNKAYADHS